MKKAALGFIALAMSLMANTAQALNGNGDIRSIDPCDQYGYVIPNGSISAPYTVGQTAYFRLRLENPNSVDSWETKNSSNPLVSPWQLSWDSTMYPGLTLSDMLAMYPPAIGVTVSGKARAARLQVNVPSGEGWYTDLICSYKVEAGDFALPMTLVSDNGKCMLGVASLAGNAINKSSLWKLISYTHDDKNNWGVITSTNTCSLLWSDRGDLRDNAPSQSESDNWTADLTLAQAGLYIKTIDFASSVNTVPQGRTERVAVNIVGGVNTNGNGTVYVKIKKDGAAVALAEDLLEEIEMWDGESTATYQIAKVTIPSGPDASSFSFKVKGLVEGGTNKVYLSSTKEFAYEDGHVGNGPAIITNFVTASVVCVAPPPPYISVTLDGESRKTVTSGQDYANYAAKLTVTLSEAYTSDVEVSVDATLNGNVVVLGSDYIGMSTFSDGGFRGTNNEVKFSVSEMSAGTLSKDLYVYVLGGNDDTAAIDKGIVFTPKAQGASASYFNNENRTATLFINKSTPVIISPAENYVHPEVNGGVVTGFKVKIADDYMNIKRAYSVEWWIDGAGTPETGLTSITPNSQGELTVPVTYIAEGEHTTAFRVKNSSGAYSDDRHFIVPVRKPKTVKAMVLESGDSSGRYTEDVGELNVRFVLSESYNRSTQPIYAYLVPLNAATSNQVDCTGLAFTEGVAILPGQTTSFMDAAIKILDGTNGALFRFKVVLSTSEQNTGNISLIGEYASQDLYIPVINKAPVISSVGMSGSLPVTVNGQTFKGKAAVGLNKVFTLTADDVEADLTNNVTVTWNFSDPNGYLFTTNMTGLLSEIKLTNTFEVAGTYDCSVKIKDKDMSDSEFAKLAPFEFKVVVSEKPALIIEFPNSNTFNETDADKGASYFDVKLSAAASRQIEVEVKCVGVPGASGVMNIATTNLTFRAGQMSQRVVIDELDGTADSLSFKGGFTVTAMVVTQTSNEDGTPWKDVYDSVTEKMYVANEPPQIVFPMETGTTNDASINVDYPLAWKIADVDADLTTGLSVVWTTSEGVRWVAEGDDLVEGVFTNKFKSGGAKTVTMTVTDKDGGVNSVTLYYKVAASKQVYVYPMGPYYGGLTALSKMYASANGIGEGRAWADGTRATESFAHTYTYGATIGSAKISASGYANGQEDRDINMAGNGYVDGDTAYWYSDSLSRDSFFYAWLIASKEEDATTYTGSTLISPVSPKAKTGTVQYPLSLPLELAGDDANPMYPDRFIEAFFSKEFYAADNMGDMNADGVPDYFATIYWSMPTGESKTVPEAMTGQAISNSGGKEGEGESATASDLANIASYNGDSDFLPEAWSSPNPLKPSTCSWAPGQPFTTLREIRGLDNGLNEPGISDYELTEAETAALYAACALAGEPAADYVAATNWAKKVGWTPEAINIRSGARLNPLDPDTDGDGMDDGWEYYFWYYSKIGAVVNGVWSRLEGRRFDITSSTKSVRISPDEIAEAFDPHVARETQVEFGMDFDNDGLTDLEEYALGTNPCDWDSDGDGASDLYEVLMGMNLCSADKNDSNPDCDFMARLDYAEDTFTLYTLENGDIYALPSATLSSAAVEASATSQMVFKVEVVAGDSTDTYWTTAEPVVFEKDGKVALASVVFAYKNISCDGADYLGRQEMLQSGTVVVSVADNATEMPSAVSVGFNWTNPETKDKEVTTKALKVFNYGGDGETFVPCTSNLVSYVDIPEGKAVVDIRKEATITLIHDQVYNHEGFDPRVAWNIDDNGLLDKRWQKQDSDDEGTFGLAGVPTNTVAYTTRDEYLLFQYRLMTEKIQFNEGGSIVDSLIENTTYPNFPIEFLTGKSAYSYNPFTFTNSTIKAYWDKLRSSSEGGDNSADVHGADTDKDGVPDGWELYVGYNPNDKVDGGSHIDTDKLSLAQEYAGVDSCNAYTNRYEGSNLVYPEVYTITKNHPGKTDNWWNKFFPTDPNNDDTDGDGLSDSMERDKWTATLPAGYNEYKASFSFIYGDNAEKYAVDGKTTCFKGGGLNPCTVDTDCDLLPDAWEYEFAGINWGADNHSITAPQTLSKADEKALTVGIAYHTKTNGGDHIRGGMDGTDSSDANFDYDNDGLANFQEYLVQTLRHLRYDDSLTPLMGVDPTSKQFVRFIPFSAWDGNAFAKKCNASGFTGLGAWQFRKLGYFALPPRKWDPIALHTTGLKKCSNYAHSEGAGYRVLLRPYIRTLLSEVQATGYLCTDPRRHDTDNDGMDDYYELFHGLNPLLGSASDPMEIAGNGSRNCELYDVIAKAYSVVFEDGSRFSAWVNNWVRDDNRASNGQPNFHAIMHPWMMGTMECDADGDGLRNDEESLKVDVAAPRNTHTDPTPLWMTDSTSTRFASFTSQYYNPDPYIEEVPGYMESLTKPDIFNYPKWEDFYSVDRTFVIYNANKGEQDEVAPMVLREGSGGKNLNWMFSFEENEGYDTDRDFRRDTSELVKGVDPTSDPLNYMDPNRRQALYLPGNESAAVSYESEARREVGTEADMLKQFTAECWICPEGAQANAVVFERVAVYGASTLSNNMDYVRANFRIGFDADGKLYGEYEGSTIDSGVNRVTYKNEVPVDAWTHVAFSYDGSTLALYLNGEIAPVDSIYNAKLIPANGIMGILQYPDGSVVSQYDGYRALPVANIIGARALNPNAVPVNSETDWSDFSDYFKGWVDEVRVWDGARPAGDIRADLMKRYTFDDVKANRENVYVRWSVGANRAGSNGTVLPPEILFHYNFVSLPGGIEERNVLTAPSGFQSAVLDNVRKPNTGDLDIALDVGWWSELAVNSKVYSNYAYVPWIPNTVAHMPLFDGSTVDSRYWSETEAGVAVKSYGEGYSYNNSANPYVGYVYRYDKLNRNIKLRLMENSGAYSNNISEVANKYKFQLRSDYVGSTDLVPLGGAFAKRKADFWDNQGAMDAWTLTSANYEIPDADGNGIPDWAEELGFTTVEAYLRALAEGLLPADGSQVFNNNFKDFVDADNDGLLDWWQRYNDLKGSASGDTDMDGLADYAEYLISGVFKFANVDPNLTKTDGNEFDYFHKVGKLYLGEMFSDHDFIEDWWEDIYRDVAETAKYDPHRDADNDGWSNYAERRAGTMPNRTATVIVDSDIWPEYPVPRINVNVHYAKALSASASVVLRAYSDAHAIEPNAQWELAGSAASEASEQFKVLGLYPGKKMKYYLGRDIIPGKIKLCIANPELKLDTLVWFDMIEERATGKDTQDIAELYVRDTETKIGTINYYTGECEIDFTAIPRKLGYNTEKQVVTGMSYGDWGMDVQSAYFKFKYSATRVQGSAPWEFMITDANSGHLREGLNTFEAFVDLDGSGTYTAGEPFGIVRDVDVKWNHCNLDIEVKDPSEHSLRTQLGFSEDEAASSRNTQIVVTRTAVNGKTDNSYGKVVKTQVVHRNIGNRAYLHEGDFMNSGEFDLDWSLFKKEVLESAMVASSKMNVTNVTYTVTVASLEQAVSNEFDVTRHFTANHITPTPVNENSVNYGARPVFKWTYDSSVAQSDWDTFTAFSIQVSQGSTAVWNSGVRAIPPRLPNGEFEWTAPICVGDLLSANHVFSNTNNYTWKISLHNARYQSATWSAAQPFRMNVYGENEPNLTGKGIAKFAVKYFGPGKVDTSSSKMSGTVRVEAYESPDFFGEPLGATFVKDMVSLTNSAHEVNATIIGLEPGAYYAIAYVDSNGNRKRDKFESWGYVCPRGDVVSKAIYDPTSIKVGDGIAVKETLYIEDVDTDQDCLPDVYEFDAASGKDDFLAAKGPSTNGKDGYIAVNPELANDISRNSGNTVAYMLSAGTMSMPSDMVALSLSIETAENTLEESTLAIKAISLENGAVNLTIGAEANEPDLGKIYVKGNTVTVTIVIKYSDSLNGEWKEKCIEKTFEIDDGNVGGVLTITNEELKKEGLDTSKGFFKVGLK